MTVGYHGSHGLVSLEAGFLALLTVCERSKLVNGLLLGRSRYIDLGRTSLRFPDCSSPVSLCP